MVVAGCGGTGKSQIINALTYYFQSTNRSEMLGKLAQMYKVNFKYFVCQYLNNLT